MCGKISMSSANDIDAQCLNTSMEDFFQNLHSPQFHKVGSISNRFKIFYHLQTLCEWGKVVTRTTRNVTSSQCGWVQVMMATLVFILPNKKEVGKKLMNWGDCKKLPWDIVLVLGGGVCSLSLSLSR